MTKAPYISVIIPLYNKESSIKKTIQSVLNQSFNNFEILVVNDQSTDKSVSVVEEINDARITVINKSNGGVSSARNLGINKAKFEWIAFLDADDYWDTDHLLNLSNAITNSKTQGFIATGFNIANSKLEVSKTFRSKSTGLFNYFQIAAENGFAVHTSSVCIKKDILVNNLFKEHLTLGEDNELFARLGKQVKVFFIENASSYYISDSENKQVLKKHHPSKDFLYQINLNDCVSAQEKKYYTIFIIHHLFKFLLIEKNVSKAKLLFKHYYKELEGIDYIQYFIHKIKK